MKLYQIKLQNLLFSLNYMNKMKEWIKRLINLMMLLKNLKYKSKIIKLCSKNILKKIKLNFKISSKNSVMTKELELINRELKVKMISLETEL